MRWLSSREAQLDLLLIQLEQVEVPAILSRQDNRLVDRDAPASGLRRIRSPTSRLNFLWEAWLRVFTNAGQNAVVSGKQRKDLTVYTVNSINRPPISIEQAVVGICSGLP